MKTRSPVVTVNPLPTTLLTPADAVPRAIPSPATAASTTTEASARPILVPARQRPLGSLPTAAVDPLEGPTDPLMVPAFRPPAPFGTPWFGSGRDPRVPAGLRRRWHRGADATSLMTAMSSNCHRRVISTFLPR